MPDNLLPIYKKRLQIESAQFERIDHEDTMIGHVFRVEESGQPPRILKISPRDQHYLREVYFLKHFAGKLPVPKILDLVEPEPGLHGAILMECIEGGLLKPVDWSGVLAGEVGVLLARIHLNTTPRYGDLIGTLTDDLPGVFRAKFEEELDECRGHLPDWMLDLSHHFLSDHIDALEDADGPCIVHRDYRPGNLIVREGKLVGVIDWAGGRSGFAQLDFRDMEHRQWPPDPAHKQALFDGYASVRPLPKFDSMMPLLRLGRALAVVGYTVRHGTWNNKDARIYQFNRHYLDQTLTRR